MQTFEEKLEEFTNKQNKKFFTFIEGNVFSNIFSDEEKVEMIKEWIAWKNNLTKEFIKKYNPAEKSV